MSPVVDYASPYFGSQRGLDVGCDCGCGNSLFLKIGPMCSDLSLCPPPPPPPCCPCVPGTTMLDHGLDRPDGCPRDLDLLQLVCSLHVRCYASCMLYLRSLCFLGKTGRKDRIFCWFDIFVSPMLGMLLDGAGSQNCCCGQGCDMATEFLISERPKVLEFQL